MPKHPVRSQPHTTAHLIIRTPGWLKNAVLDAATATGESVNTWLTHAIHQQLHHGDQRPTPRVLPDASEVIADYLAGRQTTAPCGDRWPCRGDGQTVVVNGCRFCEVCHIRIM